MYVYVCVCLYLRTWARVRRCVCTYRTQDISLQIIIKTTCWAVRGKTMGLHPSLSRRRPHRQAETRLYTPASTPTPTPIC